MDRYVLALDQGTTSSRALAFDQSGRVVAIAQREFPQRLPRPGEVEHDPEAIWASQMAAADEVVDRVGGPDRIASIGIANQRETTVVWERDSGKPVDHAIVWQSRVSAPICERLKAAGLEPLFRARTGLVLDPYFSATKIRHLLDKHEGLAARAARGEILFGTVDSFLRWRLTDGQVHVSDPSNASRTLLWNLATRDWDDELLALMNIPRSMLPRVMPNNAIVGETRRWGIPIPLSGAAGDQQAALFGQTCFSPGDAKNTYGTGCFLLLNTGHEPVHDAATLLTTVGWEIDGAVTYCLEGAVFIGGAVVQWLRDGLGIISSSRDVEQLVASVHDTGDLYFVPAFVGLGTPHWDPYARGTIVGITRGTTAAHLALAALESIAFQSWDVLDAMQRAANVALKSLQVDGGACVNDRLLQFQADIAQTVVRRPVVAETTALGAAYLAGLGVGYWTDQSELKVNWQLDREFHPHLDANTRANRLRRWHAAIEHAKGWAQPDMPEGLASSEPAS